MQNNLQVFGVQLLRFPASMDPLDRASSRVWFCRWWLLNISLIFGLSTKHCRKKRRTTHFKAERISKIYAFRMGLILKPSTTSKTFSVCVRACVRVCLWRKKNSASVYGLPWFRGFVFLYRNNELYNCVVLYILSIYTFPCAGWSVVSYRGIMKDLFSNNSNTKSQQ
jgi:hypothetical protein